jgi:hypothetical protein
MSITIIIATIVFLILVGIIKILITPEQKPLFHFEVITPEIAEAQKREKICNLKEDQLSEYVFNGEPLYETGRGHSFGIGFYTSYLTKSGVEAEAYGPRWRIQNSWYDFVDGDFVEIPETVYVPCEPANLEEISFPIVRSVFAKLASTELFQVQPMPLPKKISPTKQLLHRLFSLKVKSPLFTKR